MRGMYAFHMARRVLFSKCFSLRTREKVMMCFVGRKGAILCQVYK
jgi:hypothetical protein